MALSAHLEELNHKHTQLDDKIHDEMKHPAPDVVRITKLKKQKLHLKEKIAHFRSS
ncbi:MAG: DUF465 domain-containing protein [Robiginitomaculum sp.]|nr:MAG: DUF465 domain-containing protein [Robiginitomaculum sp.]